jgi:DNA-binding PadR family transcriptional regulator
MAKKRKVGNLLGLAVRTALTERPMHRYEIAALLVERGKDRDMDIKMGSLYTVVQNLEKHGLLEVVGSERDGARPERTIYAITEAGRAETIDWIREIVSTPEPEHHRFSAGLSVLSMLPPDEVIALLGTRLERLEHGVAAARAELANCPPEVPRLFLIEAEFNIAIMDAEIAWVRGLRTELTEGTFPHVEMWRNFHATNMAMSDIVEQLERGDFTRPA